MKNLLVCCVAFSFLVSGGIEIFRQRRRTAVLDDIIRFIRFVETELNFRSSDFFELLRNAKGQGFRYLSFENGEISVDKLCSENIKGEFSRFTERIGTTDNDGQIALCEEYTQRFSHILKEYKEKEKSSLQVNGALSVLGAVCVLVLFI